MKVAKAYRVSKRGYRVTLFYDDGSEASIDFYNFLKVFGNYRKAFLEYLLYVTVASRNEEIAREIRTKLTELLLGTGEQT